MTAYGIPVYHWSEEIGTAVIKDDGTIEMHLDKAEGYGKLLSEFIARGEVTALTLSPVMPPSAPMFPGHEKPYLGNSKHTNYNS